MFEKYLNLKEKDSSKLYLFKVGLFYIFLDEDAIEINKYTMLKLVEHANGVVKCGFPESAFAKYMTIFKNINLDIEVIENNVVTSKKNNSQLNDYLKEIKKMNISNMTPIDCVNVLNKLKELL